MRNEANRPSNRCDAVTVELAVEHGLHSINSLGICRIATSTITDLFQLGICQFGLTEHLCSSLSTMRTEVSWSVIYMSVILAYTIVFIPYTCYMLSCGIFISIHYLSKPTSYTNESLRRKYILTVRCISFCSKSFRKIYKKCHSRGFYCLLVCFGADSSDAPFVRYLVWNNTCENGVY